MHIRRLAAPEAPAIGRQGTLVLLTTCLGVLIAQIDTSVVNLAVQPIGAALGASIASLQWVLDAYNLVYAVLLLSGGLLADLYGRRRAFVAGAAVMAAASVVCAFAPTIAVLNIARAAAGLGAALLLPASLAIIRVAWPEPVARGRVLGIWASCNGLAFAIGPGLGGVLIHWFGWRSVFFLIVPLSVAACVLAALAVPESADPKGRRFDLPGQVLGAVALGALAFAAIAHHEGVTVWGSALAVSAGALLLFLLTERRAGAAALVPLDLFRNHSFSGAVAATATMTFGIYGMIFLLPLVWQSSGALGPEQAGVALMPCALAFFLLSPRSGALTQRFGARAMTAAGTALIASGLLVIGATPAAASLPVAETGLILAGLGMGLNTGPLYAVAVGAVTAARSGTAAALINVARMTGATLGVALLGAAFALLHGGTEGLRAAMLTGGAVQMCGAAVAWLAIR